VNADNSDQEDMGGNFDLENIENFDSLPKPILRVFIKNTNKKFLKLREIEEKLIGLVANEG